MDRERIQLGIFATEGETVEPDRMAYDVDVLQQVMDTHDITVKQIAAKSRIAQSTIYRYLAGERTMPSDVLQAAYAITGDMRLVALITGEMPVQITVRADDAGADRIPRPLRVPPLADTFQPTLDAINAIAECCKHLHNTFADGKVDVNDLPSLDELLRLNLAAQTTLATNLASAKAERTRIEQCRQ